jgi:hypothetical protein
MNEKYILSLSLKLVKAGGYNFPHSCDGPRNSKLFFKQPSVDTECDMPVLHSLMIGLKNNKLERT